ncbi:MAG: hypothetical protein R3B91_00535 [Planctomycetaceae bacterium]
MRAYPYGLKPQSVDEIEQYNKLEELYGAVRFDGIPTFERTGLSSPQRDLLFTMPWSIFLRR